MRLARQQVDEATMGLVVDHRTQQDAGRRGERFAAQAHKFNLDPETLARLALEALAAMAEAEGELRLPLAVAQMD